MEWVEFTKLLQNSEMLGVWMSITQNINGGDIKIRILGEIEGD